METLIEIARILVYACIGGLVWTAFWGGAKYIVDKVKSKI